MELKLKNYQMKKVNIKLERNTLNLLLAIYDLKDYHITNNKMTQDYLVEEVESICLTILSEQEEKINSLIENEAIDKMPSIKTIIENYLNHQAINIINNHNNLTNVLSNLKDIRNESNHILQG